MKVLALLPVLWAPAAFAYQFAAQSVTGEVVREAGQLTMGGKIGTYTVLLQVLNPGFGDMNLLLECCGEARGLAAEIAAKINTNQIIGDKKKTFEGVVKQGFVGKGKCRAPNALEALTNQGNPQCDYMYSFKNKIWREYQYSSVCVPSDVCAVDVAGATQGLKIGYTMVLQIFNKQAGDLVYAGEGPIGSCLEGANDINRADDFDQVKKKVPNYMDILGTKIEIGKKEIFDVKGMKQLEVMKMMEKCSSTPGTGMLYVFKNKFWNKQESYMNISEWMDDQYNAEQMAAYKALMDYKVPSKHEKKGKAAAPAKEKKKEPEVDVGKAIGGLLGAIFGGDKSSDKKSEDHLGKTLDGALKKSGAKVEAPKTAEPKKGLDLLGSLSGGLKAIGEEAEKHKPKTKAAPEAPRPEVTPEVVAKTKEDPFYKMLEAHEKAAAEAKEAADKLAAQTKAAAPEAPRPEVTPEVVAKTKEEPFYKMLEAHEKAAAAAKEALKAATPVPAAEATEETGGGYGGVAPPAAEAVETGGGYGGVAPPAAEAPAAETAEAATPDPVAAAAAEAQKKAEEAAKEAAAKLKEDQEKAAAAAKEAADKLAAQTKAAQEKAEAQAKKVAQEAKEAAEKLAAQTKEAQKKAEADAKKAAEELAAKTKKAQEKAEADAKKAAEELAAKTKKAQKKAEADAKKAAEEMAAKTKEVQEKAKADAKKAASEFEVSSATSAPDAEVAETEAPAAPPAPEFTGAGTVEVVTAAPAAPAKAAKAAKAKASSEKAAEDVSEAQVIARRLKEIMV